MCSEEKIIDLIANRDESGMRELMERYQRPLMKLAMNMLDSEEDARECVNDTFYEVWKSVPDNRPQYLFAYSATGSLPSERRKRFCISSICSEVTI